MIKALFPDSQTHPPSLLNLIIPQERIQGPFSFYSPTLVNPLKDHSFNSHLGEVKWVIWSGLAFTLTLPSSRPQVPPPIDLSTEKSCLDHQQMGPSTSSCASLTLLPIPVAIIHHKYVLPSPNGLNPLLTCHHSQPFLHRSWVICLQVSPPRLTRKLSYCRNQSFLAPPTQ